MNFIEYVFEPNRLMLVWQPPMGQGPRSRRVVAEILRTSALSHSVFRYLIDSNDFLLARSEGFEGYPAFKLTDPEHTIGVMDAFMRRLPPRNREDFVEYLGRHRIPPPVGLSDFALLAYTGAKLPSDGFELSADFSDARPPLDLVLEVAGFRHTSAIPSGQLALGETVTFERDLNNPHDEHAISICCRGQRIGFISRVYSPAFHSWLRQGLDLSGEIERINGKPERPLVYIFAKLRSPT